MKNITTDSILKTKHNFGDFIKTTPLIKSERLSELYDAEIYIKREDLQPVRSYKIRGAFNKISSLSDTEKKAGVVCASAGNHAQGVAITCNHLKIKGTIFMPITTPEQKVYKTKKFGGDYIDVVLIGDTFDDALNASIDFQNKTNATYIHPFDDPKVIEGQATVGLEVFEEINPDFYICPIGGGGFISGQIIAKNLFSPKTKIIGVEPVGAKAMKESLKLGKLIQLEHIDTFVDGTAVKKEGKLTFNICKKENLKIIECPENRVCTTILDYLKEDGIVVEPAGALTTDALKDLKDKIKNKKVVIVISGGNFDFERLPEIKEKSLKYEGLKKYFLVSFPQRPGALKDFLNVLGDGDDIERFEYLKKSAKNTAPVFIGIKTNNKKHWKTIEEKMNKLGFKYKDVTNDELYFDLLV